MAMVSQPPYAGLTFSHPDHKALPDTTTLPPIVSFPKTLDFKLPLPRTIRQSVPKPSLLERLPAEIQRMIFSRIDYQSLIFLSTTNKYFNVTIDPSALADTFDKFQFVMRAAKDFPQHRPRERGQEHHPGNFECYICYKIYGPDHFDCLQPQWVYVDERGYVVRDRTPRATDKKINLRRFCIDCGIKTGLHAPSDCLTTRVGRELWVCRCLKVWEKPKQLRCPHCSGDCPLRPRRRP